MSSIDEIKEKVGRLIAEKGLTLNSVSLKLGKNQTYLQKFVKQKSPKRLEEDFRRKLALLLEVPEQELTDLPLYSFPLPSAMDGINMVANTISELFTHKSNTPDTVTIEMLDTTACCGNGVEALSENVIGKWLMPLLDFRKISSTSPDNIKMIKVKGDSMLPTLKEDDWVLVDTKQNYPSDGMFLLRLAGNFLTVKRIQCGFGDNLTILSDNPNYQPMNATIDDADIIGKVIYALKAEKVG